MNTYTARVRIERHHIVQCDRETATVMPYHPALSGTHLGISTEAADPGDQIVIFEPGDGCEVFCEGEPFAWSAPLTHAGLGRLRAAKTGAREPIVAVAVGYHRPGEADWSPLVHVRLIHSGEFS